MEDDELAALWIAGCYLCRQGLSCFYVSSYSTPEEIQAEFAGPSSGYAQRNPLRTDLAEQEMSLPPAASSYGHDGFNCRHEPDVTEQRTLV
jgi:hypothetical protein